MYRLPVASGLIYLNTNTLGLAPKLKSAEEAGTDKQWR